MVSDSDTNMSPNSRDRFVTDRNNRKRGETPLSDGGPVQKSSKKKGDRVANMSTAEKQAAYERKAEIQRKKLLEKPNLPQQVKIPENVSLCLPGIRFY